MKLCTKCNKPGVFHKQSGTKDGLKSRCIDCCREALSKWRKENPGKRQAQVIRAYKTNPEVGKSAAKRWRFKHPELVRAQHVRWYSVNPEFARLLSRTYRKNHLHESRSRVQAWKLANPLRNSAHEQKRRAHKASVENTLTMEQWFEILEVFGFHCAYCLESDKGITMDHIIPISKGGGHTAENVVPACGECNSRKHDKMVFVMLNMDVQVQKAAA